MADLSKPDDAASPTGILLAINKLVRRLLDWFAIQSLTVRLTMLVVAVLIPANQAGQARQAGPLCTGQLHQAGTRIVSNHQSIVHYVFFLDK